MISDLDQVCVAPKRHTRYMRDYRSREAVKR